MNRCSSGRIADAMQLSEFCPASNDHAKNENPALRSLAIAFRCRET